MSEKIRVGCGITLKLPSADQPGEFFFIKPDISYETNIREGEDLKSAYERASKQVGMLFCLEAKTQAALGGYITQHSTNAVGACEEYLKHLSNLPGESTDGSTKTP